MNPTLLTLGALTLGGSAAVIALALAGRASRGRYGARWRCWGWLLLCLRLALPLSLIPQTQARAPIRVDLPNRPAVTRPAVSPGASNTPSPGNASAPPDGSQGTPDRPAPSGSASSPAPLSPERRADPAQIALAVWLLGAAGTLIWNGTAHLRFLSWLRRWAAPVTDGEVIRAFNRLGDRLGLHRRPRLLVCQGLKVPMLAGIFRPAILLPQGDTTGEELGFSLLHELTHYRRRDICLKTLAMWVNALHWFNPLMWYMVRLVERDTELACDEDALRRLPRSDYAAYGQTILNAVARLQNREKEGTQDE